ncbi:IGF-like family receptor 1 isoform X4 [Pelodiscus sinensis]|uniref:IGF-like family receptor 1 isoform X4 n=1 Tax=Pelodiscus sinensis TaxID=13735 RepID=UPI003F6C1FF4
MSSKSALREVRQPSQLWETSRKRAHARQGGAPGGRGWGRTQAGRSQPIPHTHSALPCCCPCCSACCPVPAPAAPPCPAAAATCTFGTRQPRPVSPVQPVTATSSCVAATGSSWEVPGPVLCPPQAVSPYGPSHQQLQQPNGGYGIWVVILTTLLLTAAIALFIWTQQGSLLSAEETAGSAGRAGRCGAPQSCPAAPGAQLTTPAPPSLWGLPLQHLLDDADVLEELIMLLDPEGKAGGGTRHLASRYGLSATWINYTYSLRSTRSPLRATLETVAARQPEATLGQLAGLLDAMGRKDALQVLERVRCPPGPGTTPRGPGWRKETSQAIVHPGACTPAPTRAGPGSPLLPLKHGAGLEGSGQP